MVPLVEEVTVDLDLNDFGSESCSMDLQLRDGELCEGGVNCSSNCSRWVEERLW